MVSIEGVDYSYARPSLRGLKSADKKFVVRYLTGLSGGKGITQSEFNALKKAGIAVVVVYEGGAQGALGGYKQGLADAAKAQECLKKIQGLDDDLPVYFAVDFDSTPGQQGTIDAYLDGVAGVLGRNRTGIYGGYWPVSRAKKAHSATWFWQTYAWSGGNLLDGAHLYQYHNGVTVAGGEVDLTRALQKEYGQHAPKAATKPKPVAKPKPTPKPAPKPDPKPVPVITEPAVAIKSGAEKPLYLKAEYKDGVIIVTETSLNK